MAYGGYQGVGADPYVIPRTELGDVEDDHIIVRQEIIADMDVLPGVAAEHREHHRLFSHGTEKLAYRSFFPFCIRPVDGIELFAAFHGMELGRIDLRVPYGEGHAGPHLLDLLHIIPMAIVIVAFDVSLLSDMGALDMVAKQTVETLLFGNVQINRIDR